MAGLTFYTGQQADVPQPTKKAITERIAKLRKVIDGSNSAFGTRSNNNASSTSSSVGGSSYKPSSRGISKKISGFGSSYKGKGKEKAIDTDSDDSETEQVIPEQQVKQEEDHEEKPALFGEIGTRTRPSLPRMARPEPGAFVADNAAEGDERFIMTDNCESDAESDTTIQNTPSSTPIEDLSQATPDVFRTPTTWVRSTRITTPTPAPRVIDDSDDDCVVVRSQAKKSPGRR